MSEKEVPTSDQQQSRKPSPNTHDSPSCAKPKPSQIQRLRPSKSKPRVYYNYEKRITNLFLIAKLKNMK